MLRVILSVACCIFSFIAGGQGLVLNEVSQGPSGLPNPKEYVEFLVVGTRTCTDSTLDLRKWIFDDNNGWLATGSGQGIAPGFMRFADSASWSKVPYGSIIVIYNELARNGSITLPDDPKDSNHDYIYILPASSKLIDRNETTPNPPSSNSFVYPTTPASNFLVGGDWEGTAVLANGGDGVIIVNPNTSLSQPYFSFAFGVGTAANPKATVWVADMPGGKNYYLTNSGYAAAANWQQGDVGTSNETPGFPNGGANTTWINGMRVQVSGLTVNPITGNSAVCVGFSITLSSTTAGGTWSSSDVTKATVNPTTGVVQGISAGNVTITYTVGTPPACTGSQTKTITVSSIAAITGSSSVCQGSTITLSNATAGGTWSSSDLTKAIIDPNSGIVTGVAAGTTIISYTVSGSPCAPQTFTITVFAAATTPTITGTNNVCVGSNITLSGNPTGGTWSSSQLPVATVGVTTGLVSGISAGSTLITYIVGNGSCTATSLPFTVTVNPTPATPTITAPDNKVCVGSTLQLTGSPNSGNWTASSANLTVSNTGLVSGVNAGSATINYTVTSNSCTSLPASQVITVNAIPATPVITAPDNKVCVGSTLQLSGTPSGGAWSSSSPNATVNNSGLVNGISAGTATISYTIATNGCTSAPATQAITVNALPVVPAITGQNAICMGATTTLSNTTAGGTWSSSNPAVAIINSTTGVVTTVAPGNTNITYTVTAAGCSTTSAPFALTVNAIPATPTITAGSGTAVCAGSTLPLVCSPTGGGWSSLNASIATINNSGVVTGVSAGNATINYTVTANGCTSSPAAQPIVVNAAVASTVAGTAVLCKGGTVTLTGSPTGGTWSSNSTSTATVSSTGVVTGIAGGTAAITYTSNAACAAPSAPFNVTVQDFRLTLTATPNPANTGATVNFVTSSATAYTITAWQPAAQFANQTALSQTITASANGQYYVVGKTTGGCIDTARVNLVVIQNVNDVFVPNYFTPNADGKNDLLYIYGSTIAEVEFKIFNQWGEEIFATKDKTQGWNGAYKGVRQPVGVYVYVAKVKMLNGKTVTKKGSINLIR